VGYIDACLLVSVYSFSIATLDFFMFLMPKVLVKLMCLSLCTFLSINFSVYAYGTGICITGHIKLLYKPLRLAIRTALYFITARAAWLSLFMSIIQTI
jgi:hypothetical protein